MDFLTFLLLLFSVCTCIGLLKLGLVGRKPGTASLPPGPRPLPIIGNILNLGDKVHLSLANLSKTYGPVMSLKLGSVTAIVISSSETAKEVLHINDQAFSGRTVPAAIRIRNYHQSSMVWLSASAHWRKLRKICSMQMLSMQQVDSSRGIRQKIVQKLLNYVEECGRKGCAVDIGEAAFTVGLNLLSNIIFSCDLAHYDSHFSQEFKNTVWGVLGGLGRLNFADYFPAFRLIDLQGRRREMKIHFDKLLDTFDGIIDQRLKSEAISSASKDVLDALLSLPKENDHEWSLSAIKHLLMVSTVYLETVGTFFF